VLNAAGDTVQPAARRPIPHRPLVLYVEAIIQQITKDAIFTKNNTTLSTLPKDRIPNITPQQTPLHTPRQAHDPNIRLMHKLYGALNQSPPPPNVNEPISLSTFLREFQAMFQQLIQQNTMILNMLTMLINNINHG